MNITSIKTESGCCFDDDTVVDHPPSENEDGTSSSSSIVDGIDETNLFELPLEQTYKLSYPVGCPVWYNKYTNCCTGKNNTRDVYYCGVVIKVLMDLGMSRKIYYRVEKTKGSIDHPANGDECSTQDLIQEDKVVYAAKCPVLVEMTSDNGDTKDMEGEIVCPRGKNKTKASYTVMVFMEDNKVGVEDGVISQRIKFRSKESTVTQEKEVHVVGGPSAAVSTHEANVNNTTTISNEKKKISVSSSSIQHVGPVPEKRPRRRRWDIPNEITTQSTQASSNNKDANMNTLTNGSHHSSNNKDDEKNKQLQRIVSSDSTSLNDHEKVDVMMEEKHSLSATDQRWIPPQKKRCADSISVATRIPKKRERRSKRPTKPKGTLQEASTEMSSPFNRNSGSSPVRVHTNHPQLGPKPTGCQCLFIGNLSKVTDENAIRDLFLRVGVRIRGLRQRNHRNDGSRLP